MTRSTRSTLVLLFVTAALGGCGDDDPVVTAPTSPVAVTEVLTETLTINGARTHVIKVDNSGQISATLTTIPLDEGAFVSLSLGTWNGSSCQIIIAKDDAIQGTSVIGNATVGQFCARVADQGRLTAPVEYTVTVVHY